MSKTNLLNQAFLPHFIAELISTQDLCSFSRALKAAFGVYLGIVKQAYSKITLLFMSQQYI